MHTNLDLDFPCADSCRQHWFSRIATTGHRLRIRAGHIEQQHI